MKRIFCLLFSFIFIFSLVGCDDASRGYIEPDDLDHNEEIEMEYFEAKILEINDNFILVEPIDDSNASKSADKIDVSIKNVSIDFDLIVDNIVGINYTGYIAETYPAKITGTVAVNHINGDLTNDVVPTISDDTIEFDGKIYNKSDLSESTLNWLELSEEEQMLSSYYPPEFVVSSDICDRDNIQEDWGVTLETQNVTSNGLTIVCHQLGGENIYELSTGSFYTLQKLEQNGYVEVEYLPHEYDIAWTSEAWIIQKDATTTWNVDWGWLYGELPVGEYRIGKQIMNFRGTGDYDIEMIYAHFEILS